MIGAFVLAALVHPAANADLHCNVDAGTEAAPHLEDAAGDWEGIVTGNGQALIPYGDVYRESTDVLSAWINRTGTTFTANIRLNTWSGLTETNAVYNFLWTYQGTSPVNQARRFVSARLVRPLPIPIYEFSYGWIDTSGEIDLINTYGATTGSMIAGTPGAISIVIPFHRSQLGRPGPGAVLEDIVAEARVLVGAAGTGLLGVADITDGYPCPSLTIP